MSDNLFLSLTGAHGVVTIDPPTVIPAPCFYTPDSTFVTDTASPGAETVTVTLNWGDGFVDVVPLPSLTLAASTTYDVGYLLNGLTGSPGDDNAHLHHTYTTEGSFEATVTVARPSADPITSTVDFDIASVATPFTLESVIGHYAVYNHVLDSAAVERHWLAGHTAWSGDSDGERLNRILDYIGWPSGLRDIATGSASLSGEDWDDEAPILGELQDTETNGGGTLFISADGKVTYLNRLFRVGASLDATFTVDSVTGPEVPLEWSTDPTHLINIIKATRNVPGGVTTTVLDQASIDEFGEYHDDSFSLKVTTDSELIARARDKIQRYKEPDVRVSQLVLKCSAGSSDDFWTAALSLDIGSYIELDNLPGYAPAGTISYFVESVNDTITLDGAVPEIVFSFDLSPGAIWADWTDPTDDTGDPVGDGPGTVSDFSPSLVLDTLITAGWLDPSDGALPSTYLVWLYAGDGTTLLDGPHTVAEGLGGSTTYDFTGLTVLTDYVVKVAAQAAGSTGPVASDAVTTLDTIADPGAPVSDPTSTFGEGSTIVEAGFTPPISGGLVLSYTASLYDGTGVTLLDGPQSIPSDGTSAAFTSGIVDDTDYIVRIGAVGPHATTFAADIPITTGTAPSAVQDEAITPTSDGAVITWSAPASLGTGPGVLVGYGIDIWVTSDPDQVNVIEDDTITDSTFTYTATGLDPSTGYTVELVSRSASSFLSSATFTDFTTTA